MQLKEEIAKAARMIVQSEVRQTARQIERETLQAVKNGVQKVIKAVQAQGAGDNNASSDPSAKPATLQQSSESSIHDQTEAASMVHAPSMMPAQQAPPPWSKMPVPQDGNYDAKFFQDWIDRLQAQIKPSLPDIATSTSPEEQAFVDACQAVQSSNQTKMDAEKLLDQISKQQKPVDQKEVEKAKAAVEAATTALNDVMETCLAVASFLLVNHPDIQKLLADDYDDRDLVTCMILKQAGAKKLADWCAQGDQQTAQLLGFLHDVDLQRQFLQGGGARGFEYGRAMELYHKLALVTANDNDDIHTNAVLQRLAMAVALELCSPLHNFGHKSKVVDAVQRYIHYEQAFLFGELDPAFETFGVWELRHIVNSDATDEELGWGRQSLMAYRPDLVYTKDPQWRYCRIVRTDVSYSTPDWYKNPRSYDQILSGGGKCGPRAWYGRFICKAFGIPTWGVRQPGHAAMTRWTSKGWMTCLGAGFQYSTWEGRGGLDFLLETQARHVLQDDVTYMKNVMRLEWISSLYNEDNRTVLSDCLPSPKSPWLALALMQRKRLVADAPSSSCGPGEKRAILATNCKVQALLDKEDIVDKIFVYDDRDGMIIIPAASTSKPGKETNKILFPKSFLGGRQLLLMEDSSVEYTLTSDELTSTRKRYRLTCRVCTVHRNEDPLEIQTIATSCPTGGAVADTVSIDMPYTMGTWEETKPVVVEIGGPGVSSVTLRVTRRRKQYAIAMKDIKLMPL